MFTPTVQQYTLKVDQSITPNLVLGVSYVGEHGIHLPLNADLNAAIPEVLANGSFYIPPGTPRLNPALSYGRDDLANDDSSYNALIVDLTRRFSHGVQVRANYTWSKSLDFMSASILAGGGGGPNAGGSMMIPRDPPNNWGPSGFDLRQRLSANLSYEFPVGHGKALLGKASGIADKLVSGWQVNSIVTVQTGFEFTPLVGFNRSGNGDGRVPDRTEINPAFSGSVIEGTPTQYFYPAAFLIPAAGTWGDASRDMFTGPGLVTCDLSFIKITPLTERVTLQFRAEAFNIFNNVNFGSPNTTEFTSSGALSPSVGLISATITTSRQLQLALKMIW